MKALYFLAFAVLVAQTAGQIPGGWQTPPPIGNTVREAAGPTRAQLSIVRTSARNLGRMASSTGYSDQQILNQFATLAAQYEGLRAQFRWLAAIAARSGGSRGANAAAELEGGLNIIGELFTYAQGELNAGRANRPMLARVCRALDQSLSEWQAELARNSQRLGP